MKHELTAAVIYGNVRRSLGTYLMQYVESGTHVAVEKSISKSHVYS